MKVKVLIVEDELIVAEEIKETLLVDGFDVIGTVDTAADALKIIEQDPPDIVLLDIHIKGNKDGIFVAEKINSLYPSIGIIFLTAFADQQHLDRAKSTKPAAYIIKPFNPRNLTAAVDLAFSNLSLGGKKLSAENSSTILSDRIFIKDEGVYYKLLLSEIKYIEAIGSYCEISAENKKFTFSFNMKQLELKISNNRLTRVHRSFIVNLDKVDSISGNQIIIDDKNIPIGVSYRAKILSQFNLI